MYIIAFLDRTNISFAQNALQIHLGITPRSYALAAGLFFISYAALEMPSNLVLHRIGAKPWMARIMVTWGLMSISTLFVAGNRSFYLSRLLLGAAEAGFFPGVILYLTYWFPARVRGQMLGLFYFGAPLALIFGGPISTALLHMRVKGSLQNWQWMFLVEGLMAVGVGIWSYWYLDSRPADARWLPTDEKQALVESLSVEERHAAHRPADILPMLRDVRVLHYALIYFLIQISTYGVIFYLPNEISALFPRSGVWETSLASAVPWVCALAGAYWLPRMADHTRRYRRIAALTLLVCGFASFALPLVPPGLGFVALCIGAAGFIAVQPLFWTFPANYLADRAAAAGLALINAVGALGGFFAPNVRVWADSAFASHRAGLFVLAGVSIITALVTAALRPPGNRSSESSSVADR